MNRISDPLRNSSRRIYTLQNTDADTAFSPSRVVQPKLFRNTPVKQEVGSAAIVL
jgi:hypothetical protein